jgi:hypothetical protein
MKSKKLQKFYIQCRRESSDVWLSLYCFTAASEAEAIEKSKAHFIKNWDAAFPHSQDGAEVVKGMVFEYFGGGKIPKV